MPIAIDAIVRTLWRLWVNAGTPTLDVYSPFDEDSIASEDDFIDYEPHCLRPPCRGFDYFELLFHQMPQGDLLVKDTIDTHSILLLVVTSMMALVCKNKLLPLRFARKQQLRIANCSLVRNSRSTRRGTFAQLAEVHLGPASCSAIICRAEEAPVTGSVRRYIACRPRCRFLG